MKKLALLVGSLLAVSAAASAKEVVPAPAQAPEVKIVEKVVQVPVEKIVVKEVIKEAEKKGPKGAFSVSYAVPLYSDSNIFGDGHKWKNFWEEDRQGTLEVAANVEIAPKHKISTKTELALELVPSYVKDYDPKTTELEELENDLLDKKVALLTQAGDRAAEKLQVEAAEKALNDKKAEVAKAKEDSTKWKVDPKSNKVKLFNLGYTYEYNDKASLNATYTHKSEGFVNKDLVRYEVLSDKIKTANATTDDKKEVENLKLSKTEGKAEVDKIVNALNNGLTNQLEVKATFDAAEYFFSSDNFKTKEVKIIPSYSYSWTNLYVPENGNYHTKHKVALDVNSKFEVPYGIELGVDLNPITYTVYNAKYDNKEYSRSLVTGALKLSASKGFDLLESGNHKVALSNDISYKVNFNYNDLAKNIGNGNFIGTRLFTYEPALKYTYKINEYASVFTSLNGELKMTAVKEKEKDTKRTWDLETKVKTGLEVKF